MSRARTAVQILLAATLMCAAVTPNLARHNPAQRIDRSAIGWRLADFVLHDQRGRPFTNDSLRGRWTFVLFGGPQCGQLCDQALCTLNGMRERIAKTEAVKTTQVVLIGLDSTRDAPEWLQTQPSCVAPEFIIASGPGEARTHLADDVDFSIPGAAQAQAAYAGADSQLLLILIGPDATVRAKFLPPFDVLLLTAQYLKTRYHP